MKPPKDKLVIQTRTLKSGDVMTYEWHWNWRDAHKPMWGRPLKLEGDIPVMELVTDWRDPTYMKYRERARVKRVHLRGSTWRAHVYVKGKYIAGRLDVIYDTDTPRFVPDRKYVGRLEG